MDDENSSDAAVMTGEEHKRGTRSAIEAKSLRWEKLPWPGLSLRPRSHQLLFILLCILIRPTLEGAHNIINFKEYNVALLANDERNMQFCLATQFCII